MGTPARWSNGELISDTNSHMHRVIRAQVQEQINRGEGVCCSSLCLRVERGGSRRIAPGEPFHLSHRRNRDDGFLGPSHPACNEWDAQEARRERRGQQTPWRPSKVW